MAAWLWMAVATIVASWAALLYALTGRRWNFASLVVGVFHMLFAATLSFAPFRSWFDRNTWAWAWDFCASKDEGQRSPAP